MAYANRWRIPFKDFAGSDRNIYIQQEGWTGGVTDLIPGKNPMIWEEDNSEDLTKRVRGKTGHIEVIEENFGDLAELYPTKPFTNRVVCSGSFWGYIKAQNSTNAWESGRRTLKLNILSPLAMAYDIPMTINTTMDMREMGDVMKDLMSKIGYKWLTMPIGTSTNKGDFFRGSIRGMLINPYANDKDYHYANDNEVFAPISIGELLEYICERHDMIVHDVPMADDAELLFTRMTNPGTYYEWSYANITAGNYDTASIVNFGTLERNLLTEFTVADNNNTEQLVLPYSTIDVTHVGEQDSGSIVAPTEQSQIVEPASPNFQLTPRGIWLQNRNEHVWMHGDNLMKAGTGGHDADDYENVDVIDVNPTQNPLPKDMLMFSIVFHNISKANTYNLKFSYSHRKEGSHDSIKISARGKNGWYDYGGESSTTISRPSAILPTETSENRLLVAIGGGTTGEETFDRDIRIWMVPDEYIIVNFYVGGQALERCKFFNISLEASQLYETLGDRYAEKRFVERYPGSSTGEKKILNYALRLNDTFFSNYYVTDFAFSNEVPYYLTTSQRRVRVTVRAYSLNMFWYFYKYYIVDQTAKWKLVAVSYDVRNKKFTLTLHYNNNF